MQLQNRALALHMQGEDIKQLHQQLQHSGYTIPPTELEQASFGEATKQAVLDFQRTHGLQLTGVVDQPTAELLGPGSGAAAQTFLSRPAPSPSFRSGLAAGSIIRVPPLPIPLPIPLPPDPGVRHLVTGQLLDQVSGRPVVGFTIHGFDLDGGTTPVDLGSDITDKRGMFELVYITPASTALGAVHRLQLHILDTQGQELQQIMAQPQEGQVLHVHVTVPLAPITPSPKIADLAAQLKLPAQLVTALSNNGIVTLADIAKQGGVRQIKDPAITANPAAVQTLEAHANLSRFSSDIQVNTTLIQKGYTSVAAIANAARGDFVVAVRDLLGDFKAAQMQVKARAQASFLNQVLADVRSASANGHTQTLPDAKIDPRLISPTNYIADITALSAMAYLLDLLDYAVMHLQVAGTTVPPSTSAVTLATLRGLFQQPFDTLPVADESMSTPVALVRLCIEALRGYLQSKPPTPAQQPQLAQAVNAYYLATYTALLTGIGTSFDELRALRNASNDERQALANRLGIDLGASQPDPLKMLFLDPTAAANSPQALSESALETLFGLVNTTRDPFAPGSIPLLQQWQQQHLRTLWAAQDATDWATYPLIDPDQISQADLSASPAGKTALSIWQVRRTLVDNTLARLKTFPKTLTGLDGLLQSTLNFTSTLLKALADERAQGTDITSDLDRLHLENADFIYLVRIQDLLHTNAPVLDLEWADVYAIVAEAQKRGQFAQWRQEEQAKLIILSPDFFQISDASAPQLPAWLASKDIRRTWQETLQARIDQEQTVIDALHTVVRTTEAETLPQLREALILTANASGTALEDGARTLAELLLIDTATGGQVDTTRVDQMIETMQNILFGVRTGQLSAHPELVLAAEHFDDEWAWLSTFDTWRSVTFAFLYPENLLFPALKPWQTQPFRDLTDSLRSSSRLTPVQARSLARQYADYYHDVCTLQVQASCQASTRIYNGDSTQPQTATDVARVLLYLFGLGQSKAVYWSAYDAQDDSGYAQTFWEAVPGLEKATQVVGAVPFNNDKDDSFIYLFVTTRDKGQQKLVFTRYNLERRLWDDQITDLELPSDATTFQMHALQTHLDSAAPELALYTTGKLYIRALSSDGSGWARADSLRSSDNSNSPSPSNASDSGSEWGAFERETNLHIKTLHAVLSVYTPLPVYWLIYTGSDTKLHVVELGLFAILDSLMVFHSGIPVTLTPDVVIGGANSTWLGTFLHDTDDAIYVYYQDTSGAISYSLIKTTTQTAVTPPLITNHLGNIPNLQGIAPGYGPPLAEQAGQQHLVCTRSGFQPETYLAVFSRSGSSDDLAIQGPQTRVLPLVGNMSGAFDILDQFSEQQRQFRRGLVVSLFSANADGSASNLTYLQEAYYFVPMALALQLCQSAQYLAALDWFLSVYDYSIPVAQRTVCIEQPPGSVYDRAADWTLDPLNPHTIAAARAGAYTRFTIIAIVRCLLDFADDGFTRATGESLAQARQFYLTASDLLDVIEQMPPTTPGLAPSPKPIKTGPALAEKADILVQSHVQLLRQPTIASAADQVGALAASDFLHTVSRVSGIRSDILDTQKPDLPWLRKIAAGTNSGNTSATLPAADPLISLQLSKKTADEYVPMIVYRFAVPPNFVLQALRLREALNLFKLRNGLNIAGLELPVEPLADANDAQVTLPAIGGSQQLVLPGPTVLTPTPYRYATLIERARQLTQLAIQTEAAMLAALEKFDAEEYNLLKARQDVRLGQAQVRLQDLRVREANDGTKLAELQQQRAEIQADNFQKLIREGFSGWEKAALVAMGFAIAFEVSAAVLNGKDAIIAALTLGFFGDKQGAAATASSLAAAASATANLSSTLASFERRAQEWQFQLQLAQQDRRIGAQQIRIANDQVAIVGQERAIAQMQADDAEATVNFLEGKFTNANLFDWMSGILQQVYAYFLQQATATALLAAQQLQFERQGIAPPFIQADYWQPPAAFNGSADGSQPDRRGLTGAERLQEDLTKLDQFAFDTNQRKLQLSKTISLARLSPAEFQQFRETGVISFATPMVLFDRDFPGHYLRLIRRVKVSVVALTSPVDGIRATLSNAATSRVVVGNDGVFQPPVVVNRSPQLVALSSPRDATGMFDLDIQPEMLFPFESCGVDTNWEFHMPRAANQFDYQAIADVLFTIEYTALDSPDYRKQVIQTLDPTLSSDQPFSFRDQFADQWYDLHNPDQTATPMAVRFSTSREDFAPNLENLAIAQVVLYFAPTEGQSFEVQVTNLRFTPQSGTVIDGGSAQSMKGVISTRGKNASNWTKLFGKTPVGEWELDLSGDSQLQGHFKKEEIENILFVITYSGRLPTWLA